MILGSLAAPVVAWRTLAHASDRSFAIAALVLGCIDAVLIALVLAFSVFG
jgi:hypothetical protein